MTDAERSDRPKTIGTRVLRPRQQVEEQIKAAILSGTLRTGDRLPSEVELTRQFGVSRATVREALRALVAKGLLETVPGAGGGSFVRGFDHTTLRNALVDSVHGLLALGSLGFEEVAILRQYLEVPSVRLAAANRSEQDLTELEQIVELQKTISVDDPRVPALDEQFHGTIARASGNRALATFVSALHLTTEPVHYLDLSPEVGRETVRQHQRILRAIADMDPDAGESSMTDHLSYLRGHIAEYQSR